MVVVLHGVALETDKGLIDEGMLIVETETIIVLHGVDLDLMEETTESIVENVEIEAVTRVKGLKLDIDGEAAERILENAEIDAVTVVHGVEDRVLLQVLVMTVVIVSNSVVGVDPELLDAVTVVHGVEDDVLLERTVDVLLIIEEVAGGRRSDELELTPCERVVVVHGVLDAWADIELLEQVLQHVAQLLMLYVMLQLIQTTGPYTTRPDGGI